MRFDHVGIRVDSLDNEISAYAADVEVSTQVVPAALALALWGRHSGDLRVWFHHDPAGSTEYFEQLDSSYEALPQTHICFSTESLESSLIWWRNVGFESLSQGVVEAGNKRTVMLRSADGTVVQLVSRQNEDHEGV